MLTTLIRKVQYDISGSVPATFEITFPYWNKSEINAVLSFDDETDDETLALTTNFTLSDPGDTGTLTRVGTWTSGAVRLTIYREIEATQDIDLRNGDRFDGPTVERALDRMVALGQQFLEQSARQVAVPITDTSATLTLPAVEQRKSKIAAFDADGNIIGAETATATPVTTFMTGVLDDPDAVTAQKTLGLIPSDAAAAIPAASQEFLENGADSGDLVYNPATSGLGAATGKAAVDELASMVKGLITDIGITYDSAQAATQFKRALIGRSYRVASYVFTADEAVTSEDWPAVRLDDQDRDISETNYPLLVSALRAVKLKSDSTEDFTVSIAAGVLTYPNDQASNRLLAALNEERLVHGSYSNWLSVTIGSTEYAITAIDTVARTITVSGSPPTGSQTATIFPYRIPGSTTTARLRKVAGKSLVARGGDDGEEIAGLRRRDRMQQITGTIESIEANNRGTLSGGTGAFTATGSRTGISATASGTMFGGVSFDSANSPGARTGTTTHTPDHAVYCFMWAGRYVPS